MIYAGCMRYPDNGGLSAQGQVRLEMVRLQAARMSEQDVSPVQVVSTKSVHQWRRRWRAAGEAALASHRPGGAVCRLSPAQLAKLQAALDGGRLPGAGIRTSGGPWPGSRPWSAG